MSKKRNHSKNAARRPAPAPSAPAAVPATTDRAAVEFAVEPVGDALEPAVPVTASTGHGVAEADASQVPVAAPAPIAEPVAVRAADDMSDIRGVLIQVAGAKLLLPNATIAEVLSFADPEPFGADAPEWLLGRMRWRGWQVPLIAFGRLTGAGQERAGLGTKVVVLKALSPAARTPYFAMLTQGFPRLVTVSRDGLVLEDDTPDALPRAVQARVRLNEDEALLPDLDALEGLMAEALAEAA